MNGQISNTSKLKGIGRIRLVELAFTTPTHDFRRISNIKKKNKKICDNSKEFLILSLEMLLVTTLID